MKIKIIIIFLFLWAVTATSLLAVILLGENKYLSRKGQESGHTSSNAPMLSKNVSANMGESEFLKLLKENSDLQKAVKSLQDKLLKTKSANPINAYHDLAKASVEELWNKEFSSYYYKKSKHLFKGLDTFTDLTMDLIAAGESGIDILVEVAIDNQRVKEERQMAWDILSLIPNKRVLETIMTNLSMEDRDSLCEVVWRQLKKLPTSEVEEFIPELNNLIYNKYPSAGSLDDDEIKTLSFLALKHESSESLNILSDSGVCDKSDTPLIIADYLHTDSTRHFIEEKYSDHPNETYREEAQEILNCW